MSAAGSHTVRVNSFLLNEQIHIHESHKSKDLLNMSTCINFVTHKLSTTNFMNHDVYAVSVQMTFGQLEELFCILQLPLFQIVNCADIAN